MSIKKEILGKIRAITAAVSARAVKVHAAAGRVSRRPQRGSSRWTSWDRHRPDYYRPAQKQ